MGPQEGLHEGFKRGFKRGLKRGFKRGLEQGMLECEAHINAHHDLAGLCAPLPRRVQKLLDKEGTACITDLICTSPDGALRRPWQPFAGPRWSRPSSVHAGTLGPVAARSSVRSISCPKGLTDPLKPEIGNWLASQFPIQL